MHLHGETLVSVPLQEMNVRQCLVQQHSVHGTEPCAGQQSSVFPCWHYIIRVTEGKHHMQNRSTFNVGNAACACPAVYQTDEFTRLFPLTPGAVLGDPWLDCAGVGMLANPHTHSRRWNCRDCTAELSRDAGGAWEANSAGIQGGSWEPSSQLPPSPLLP